VKNEASHKNQKNRDDHETRAQRPDPVHCVIENAAWNGKFVSTGLMDFLESIREPYNRVLRTGPDFSQAYKDAGTLRRQNPEYQKQRTQNQRQGYQRQGNQRSGAQNQRSGVQNQRQGGQNSRNTQSDQQTMDRAVNQVVSKVLAQFMESGSPPVANYWTAQRPSGWGQRQEAEEPQDQGQGVEEQQDHEQEDQGQQVQDLDQTHDQAQTQQKELVDQDGFQVVIKRSNRPKKNVKNTKNSNSRARVVNQS